MECFFAGKDSVKRGMPKVTAQIIIGTPGTVIDVRSLLCLPYSSVPTASSSGDERI